MSKFIKSSAELSAARIAVRANRAKRYTGFTEAEKAAADWARPLEEVREKLSRPTNGDIRGHKPPAKVLPDTEEVVLVKVKTTPKKKDRKGDKLEKGVRKLEKRLKKEEKQRKKAEKKNRKRSKVGVIKGTIEIHSEDEGDLDSEFELITQGQAVMQDLGTAMEGGESNVVGRAADPIEELIANAQREAAALTKHLKSAAQATEREQVLVGSSSRKTNDDQRSASRSPVPQLPQAAPRDPVNPLDQAYNLKAYKELLLQKQRDPSTSSTSSSSCSSSAKKKKKKKKNKKSKEKWDHEPFLERSLSPCRERTDGAMWNTRKGAWRSRAGGVYLPPPPKDPKADGFRSPTRSPTPARYLHPEQFKRNREPSRERRRSPSYGPEPRPRSSSASANSPSRSRQRNRGHGRRRSSSPSRVTSKRAKRSKQNPSPSPSPAKSRGSPVYALDEGTHAAAEP